MAYHIHNCEMHDDCAVLVNQNTYYRIHFNVTNLVLCQIPKDDECGDKKVD